MSNIMTYTDEYNVQGKVIRTFPVYPSIFYKIHV